MPRCPSCNRSFPDEKAVRQHGKRCSGAMMMQSSTPTSNSSPARKLQRCSYQESLSDSSSATSFPANINGASNSGGAGLTPTCNPHYASTTTGHFGYYSSPPTAATGIPTNLHHHYHQPSSSYQQYATSPAATSPTTATRQPPMVHPHSAKFEGGEPPPFTSVGPPVDSGQDTPVEHSELEFDEEVRGIVIGGRK